MTTLIRVNCARCGSFNYSLVVRTPDYETNLPGEFEVGQCKDCNYVYTALRPIASELFTRFYPDNYLCYGTSTGSKVADFMDYIRTQAQVRQRVRYLMKNITTNTSCSSFV